MALTFFNNKVILEISTKGLLINETNFNPWTDIEYLYFEKEEDSDGSFTYCLVECLKNKSEYKVDFSASGVSTEKLGGILYAYMKKYNI